MAGFLASTSVQMRFNLEPAWQTIRGMVEGFWAATLLRAEDGRRVVIPNTNLFTTMLLVRSGGPPREGPPTDIRRGTGL